MKKKVLHFLFNLGIVFIISLASGCHDKNSEDYKLIFSCSSGFYNEDFDLKLSCPSEEELEIRYTLDGSAPNSNSKVYESSIATNNIVLTNISNIPTTLTPGAKRKWKKPNNKNNSIVVRAQLYSQKKQVSKIYTQTYFIVSDSSVKSNLPIVSITTDPENLFDDEKGILVPGKNKNLANYDQRGRSWERPIHLSWFDSNGKQVIDQQAGIRIHGGTSRQYPMKGLRLYAREEYGASSFNYSIFQERKTTSYQRFILRPSGHDFYLTFFRDALIQSFAKDLDIDYSAVQPIVLYINGEYWGLTNARERFDEYYIKQHHGFQNAYICDNTDINFEKTLELISDLNPREKRDYDKIKKLIDIQSFTDFKIFESFFYRWDLGNVKPWRETENSGQWKFILSDFDVGMGGFWSQDNPSEFNFFDYMLDSNGPWKHLQGHDHNNQKNTIVLRKLLENEEYGSYFISRYTYFLDEIFTTDKMLQAINVFAPQIQDEIPNHILRWGYPNSFEEWETNVENLRKFARARPNIVRQQLKETFIK